MTDAFPRSSGTTDVPQAWAAEAGKLLRKLSHPEVQVIFGLSAVLIAEREGPDAPLFLLALVLPDDDDVDAQEGSSRGN